MKAYAVVHGPRRKVLSVALDRWTARHEAAAKLDFQAVCGITGSHHQMDRVLREHRATVVQVEFDFAKPVLKVSAA
ncbi:hypothetical protein [Variovorax sp. PMC12]|uniref:hypothetical protein n=1 Tax=Variovorax sp. PMC12 TaxID=2126319 RepID=UPI00131DDDB1|nr:hypothetical protein [Variovorax sp. PMC12]